MSLLFPLNWKHTFIPILPSVMIDVIDAPLPFLIGIESETFKEGCSEINSEDVFKVYLDTNQI